MVSVSEYRKYREISRELNSKIMDLYIDEYRLEKAIDFLGIEKEEGHAIFESEWELHILMDFAIHEIRKEGKTAVEVYQEEVNPDSEAEKRVLRAYLSSYTSLFKVKSIKRDESSLMLKDLLEGEENSELVDYSLSRSALPGHLFFTVSNLSISPSTGSWNAPSSEQNSFWKPISKTAVLATLIFRSPTYYAHPSLNALDTDEKVRRNRRLKDLKAIDSGIKGLEAFGPEVNSPATDPIGVLGRVSRFRGE
ncbi:hypothetical protein AKJ65_04805 [candidate division MSBL1 archaeon SCGC-AAA259E19]|uniref:Uncharacterized protein n=1 Tax=candidate division MSBL1 archaeon SCGC-AAA259E19 TaxID=1698264 RepID=A0A133UJP1_9EURY|nr:hypothetical protein AKJ65_04805 [candidate division MSBL1 archaeon SCGC-AAA259E19]